MQWYNNCVLKITNHPLGGVKVAKSCAVCNKIVVSGNKVSHSNRKTKRTWAPNIHRVRVILEGSPATINVCARCLRAGKVQRSV